MKAMVLESTRTITAKLAPLVLRDIAEPRPDESEVLIRVAACGVCHTELDEIEGRAPPLRLPMVLGHQAVGSIVEKGRDVDALQIGQRVGVAWIYSACGRCAHCLTGNENLCSDFRATGRDADGGYAEYMRVPAAFVHPIPAVFSDLEAAPLLCAGAIGYRSLRLAGLRDGDRLGLTGFGASAHLVLKMVRHRFPSSDVYVFARQPEERSFARQLGAVWAGDTAEPAPQKLRAVIDTTPVWLPVVAALENLDAGGRLVINAIRKEEADQQVLTTIDYPRHLWLEKEVKSVANVARRDVREFLALAAEMGLRPEIEVYDLADANQALIDLKLKRIRGAKVLQIA